MLNQLFNLKKKKNTMMKQLFELKKGIENIDNVETVTEFQKK